MSGIVSEFDAFVYQSIRNNVGDFIRESAVKYDRDGVLLLDIAPQDHAGAKQFFEKSLVLTADIDPSSGADYVLDVCNNNSEIVDSNYFDVVLCAEVLEHCLNPFSAIEEMRRIIKPGGILLLTTPFNFRIHGPLPDCWRFTEHGLRALLSDFVDVRIEALDDSERFLMPLHYTTVAKKPLL